MVRQRSAKPLFVGSTPIRASNNLPEQRTEMTSKARGASKAQIESLQVPGDPLDTPKRASAKKKVN